MLRSSAVDSADAGARLAGSAKVGSAGSATSEVTLAAFVLERHRLDRDRVRVRVRSATPGTPTRDCASSARLILSRYSAVMPRVCLP
jgi:hypothetical protein